MEIKFKKLHENAILPSYAKYGDAGLDFVATEVYYDKKKDLLVVKTGIAMEIPYGYVGLALPRSSIANKNLLLSNSVGVIDSGYRGEILAKFRMVGDYVEVDMNLVGNEDNEVTNDRLSLEGYLDIYPEYRDYYSGDTYGLDVYKVGEKCFQMIILPIPKITPKWVKELSASERGEGGYGSTGE